MNQPPPDCFTLEDLQAFQALEGMTLEAVQYYLWLHPTKQTDQPQRFLYALELLFEDGGALLLSSGEDSEAIRRIRAADLVGTASRLHDLHGKALIQRVQASPQPLWKPCIGQPLLGIRLSANEEGLYYNDMLLLDFENDTILLQLNDRGGLLVGAYVE
jgi:hypothetical protein